MTLWHCCHICAIFLTLWQMSDCDKSHTTTEYLLNNPFFQIIFLGRLSHCHIYLSQLGPWYLKKTTSNHPLPEYTPKLPILPTHARVIALPNGLKYSWTVCRSKRETVLDTHAFKNNIVASVRVLISFYHRNVGWAVTIMTFTCVLDRGNSAFASPVNFLG